MAFESDLQILVAAIIAVLGYILAYLKHKETTNVQDFFDPASPVTAPPKGVPQRSYEMSPDVLNFLLSGHKPNEQFAILEQIKAAEDAGITAYTIKYPSGFYNIRNGQIASSGGDGTK